MLGRNADGRKRLPSARAASAGPQRAGPGREVEVTRGAAVSTHPFPPPGMFPTRLVQLCPSHEPPKVCTEEGWVQARKTGQSKVLAGRGLDTG